MSHNQGDQGSADDAMAHPRLRNRLRNFSILLALLLASGLVLYSGFIVGKSEASKKEVLSSAVRIAPVKPVQESAIPARAAMEKAAVLMDQNRYAYEQTYLGKRYRVTGKIGKVLGPRDIASLSPEFVVILESWRLGKWPFSPKLAFVELPNDVQMSLRPGQEVDATCVLAEWMTFENCRVNRSSTQRKEDQGEATAELRGSTSNANTVAVSSRQSAEGVTESQMDQAFLARLEQWSLERMRVHTSKAMKDRARPFDPADLSAESLFVDAGGKKLAVTRFKVGTVTPSAAIVGLAGNELVRVMCMTNALEDVVITRGPCNDKIKEALGVSMDPRE